MFAARGIRDVSIQEIAHQAGVSQVSIYNYFTSKQNLARKVLVRQLDEALALYDDILAQDIPFLAKLEKIMAQKESVAARITSSRFSPSAWEDPALQAVYRDAALIHARSIYTRFIRQGKADGVIDRDIPADAIMDFILASVHIMQKPDYPSSSMEYKTGLFRLFLYGLLGRKPE